MSNLTEFANASTTNYPSLSEGRDITALFLGWQDYQSDLWLPVGKMTWAPDLSQYCFRYTQGMEKVFQVSIIQRSILQNDIRRLSRVINTRNVSTEFKNRMPSKPTRYFPKHLTWLGLPPDPIDSIAYVSRSGGKQHGDSFDVFPEVRPDPNGDYHFHFFPLNLCDVSPELHINLMKYLPGHSFQIVDGMIEDGMIGLGELPGYLLEIARSYPEAIEIELAQVNLKAPQSHSLLCHATIRGKFLTPFQSEPYLFCVPF